jgi:hypothetical protein
LELPETDGKYAQSSAGGMTGKMGMRPFDKRMEQALSSLAQMLFFVLV